jgi:hypothetical protein
MQDYCAIDEFIDIELKLNITIVLCIENIFNTF